MLVKTLLKNWTYLMLFLLQLFCMQKTAKAQVPNWSVDETRFQYTMTFLGFINMDGTILSNTNDKIGAFVNGECRGVASLIYESGQKRYYVYLTVFANTENEMVNFKIYNSTNSTTKDVVKTLPFVINNHYGSLLQAYCFSNTSLSSAAELTDINLINATRKSIQFNGTTVQLIIDKQQDISALNTSFTISDGASLFVNGVKLISGSNTLNYASAITMRVRSQDESVVKDWTVNLTTPFVYYRKAAVCYAKGEIKVECPKNGSYAELLQNGVVIAKQLINNGVVLFKNINAGNYEVLIAGISKPISIVQK